MADIIQLLPDAIANQIAAGEVVQRPASVVKELIENSIDAGSTRIQLIVKDAGSTLIQVIDNGCGMSETDARMSFERHATSKIKKTSDLYAIRTMGFRGEALASIAAIAQVELRTRRKIDELGIRLVVEGSEVKTQEPCQFNQSGTSIAVKNIFFNTPARRNFLKSPSVEMRHIIDEFQRIAIANPDVHFSLHHNNTEIFHLQPGNDRQRVIALLGANTNKKLIPVREETDVLNISGFVGKPEFARKTRGEQYFFINKRFIKSPYLNHAVLGAYENLLPDDTYPLYIIFIEVDPQKIDINVHPTKQEIKFDEERLVYNYLKVAVRHALGQATPTLDFDQEVSFNPRPPRPIENSDKPIRMFKQAGEEKATPRPFSQGAPKEKPQRGSWEELYAIMQAETVDPSEQDDQTTEGATLTLESSWSDDPHDEKGTASKAEGKAYKAPYQIHNAYIVSQIKSGFLLIDQEAAHERILYEQYLAILQQQQSTTQNQLFPQTFDLTPTDALLFEKLLPQLTTLGFDIRSLGNTTFAINGVPSEMVHQKANAAEVIENLVEQYKNNLELNLGLQENIAQSLARSAAIKRGENLSIVAMQELIDKLFACQIPFKSPSGYNCFLTFELQELIKRFSQ
jgi:DNA mismatch repair protein MutL